MWLWEISFAFPNTFMLSNSEPWIPRRDFCIPLPPRNSWGLHCLRGQVVVWMRPWSGRSSSGKDKSWHQRRLQALNAILNSVKKSTGSTLLRSLVTWYRGTLVTVPWPVVPRGQGLFYLSPNSPCQQQWGYPDQGAPPYPTLPSVRWMLSLRGKPVGVVTNPGLSLVQLPSLKRVSVGLLTVGIK